MNAIHTAQHGYTAAPVRTYRGTEYDAFAKITHRLTSAAADGRAAFGPLAEALHENRQLWTLLAADVAEDDNGLPDELRARILYLAEFTAQHTRKVLRGSAEAAPLIEINTAIMRGLRNMEVAA